MEPMGKVLPPSEEVSERVEVLGWNVIGAAREKLIKSEMLRSLTELIIYRDRLSVLVKPN